MCSQCAVTEGFCFCGTTMDPQGRTEPCDVKKDPSTHCPRCDHDAGAIPLDVSTLGDSYTEFS